MKPYDGRKMKTICDLTTAICFAFNVSVDHVDNVHVGTLVMMFQLIVK